MAFATSSMLRSPDDPQEKDRPLVLGEGAEHALDRLQADPGERFVGGIIGPTEGLRRFAGELDRTAGSVPSRIDQTVMGDGEDPTPKSPLHLR